MELLSCLFCFLMLHGGLVLNLTLKQNVRVVFSTDFSSSIKVEDSNLVVVVVVISNCTIIIHDYSMDPANMPACQHKKTLHVTGYLP